MCDLLRFVSVAHCYLKVASLRNNLKVCVIYYDSLVLRSYLKVATLRKYLKVLSVCMHTCMHACMYVCMYV